MRKRRYAAILVVALMMSVMMTAGVTAYDGRVLERNMEGTDVSEIQKMLEALGYDLTVDGYFGPKTEDAVRTFQQESGILADGVVGPETLKAIRAAGQNQVHRVRRGDSLTELANLYGSTVAGIMDANDLTDDTIYIGQKLTIPALAKRSQEEDKKTGEQKAETEESKGTPVMMTYQVQRGESAYVIAKKFNTTVSAIAEANSLRNPDRLAVGQDLLIPTVGGRSVTESFRWPVTGRITSGYGWRVHPVYKNRQFHGGLDIAVPSGTIVRAAASGKVIRSENMGGFGLGVVIDHGNGVTTWYGHNSKLLVKRGETVVRGQAVSKSGSTGISTGPHLDFRIKVDGNTVNPTYWLP